MLQRHQLRGHLLVVAPQPAPGVRLDAHGHAGAGLDRRSQPPQLAKIVRRQRLAGQLFPRHRPPRRGRWLRLSVPFPVHPRHLHHLPGMMEPCLDGTHRHACLARHLGLRQLVEVVAAGGAAVGLRQVRDQLACLTRQLTSPRLFVGCRRQRLEDQGGPRNQRAVQRLGAHLFEAGGARDRHQPAAEALGITQLAQPQPGVQERFLGHILGVLGGIHQPRRHALNRGTIPRFQLREGRRIPGQSPPHQPLITFGHGSQLLSPWGTG